MPSANRSSIEAILNKVFEDSRPLPEMHKWRPVWDKMEQIKNANRGLLIDLRNDRTARKDQTFAEYYLSLADKAATDLIHQQLAPAQPQTILDAWRRDPALYPHFTAYLEASIYGLYDAERNQKSPLDRNWHADAEQLCFLVDVDVIVSSDQGFMKRAFEELWKPRGKRMMTPEEFVESLT